jgi:hypothetical protein
MDKDLKDFTRKILIKSMFLSEEWFDKSLTFISGGALLLSISFIDKLVPFKNAIVLWILIVAWLSLITSLVINLLAHRRASLNAMLTVNELDDVDVDENIARNNAQKRNKKMKQLTLGAVWSMGTGLLCLIIYCSINLYNMPDPTKLPNSEPEKKGIPSYVPQTQPAPKPQVQPPPNPAPPKKP